MAVTSHMGKEKEELTLLGKQAVKRGVGNA